MLVAAFMSVILLLFVLDELFMGSPLMEFEMPKRFDWMSAVREMEEEKTRMGRRAWEAQFLGGWDFR